MKSPLKAVFLLFVLLTCFVLVKGIALERGGKSDTRSNERASESDSGSGQHSTARTSERGGNRFEGKTEEGGYDDDAAESTYDSDNENTDESPSVEGDTYHFAFEWKGDKIRNIGCDLSMNDIRKSEQELEKLELSKDPFALLGIDWSRLSDSERNLAFWKTLYRYLLKKNTDRINSLTARFAEIRDKEKMNENQTLNCVLTFVQNFRYRRPGGSLDVLAQPDALYRKFGDCDTKSLLLVTILEKLGYDTVIFYSSYYSHVMTGIYMNGSGTYMKIGGKKYYFTETTYSGWKPGTLPPEFGNTRYWDACQIL